LSKSKGVKAAEAKKKDTTETDSTNSDKELAEFLKGEEYRKQCEVLQHNRMLLSRIWIVIVSVYYFVRATLIIFPSFSTETKQQ